MKTAPLAKHPPVVPTEVAAVLDAFPGQPMDFFGAIKSRLADAAVREWLQQQVADRGLDPSLYATKQALCEALMVAPLVEQRRLATEEMRGPGAVEHRPIGRIGRGERREAISEPVSGMKIGIRRNGKR